MRKKVISPEQRRRAARAVVASELCSGRAACRFLKVSRSTYWYRSKEPTSQEQRLLKRLRELSEKHARYGYRRIAALLRQEGWPVGKRHVQRLRRSSGLRVPPTKRKVVRRGISTGLPTKAEHRSHVWSWDFISDATTRGGALRMLTILDEYTRECHVLRADRALKTTITGRTASWATKAQNASRPQPKVLRLRLQSPSGLVNAAAGQTKANDRVDARLSKNPGGLLSSGCPDEAGQAKDRTHGPESAR